MDAVNNTTVVTSMDGGTNVLFGIHAANVRRYYLASSLLRALIIELDKTFTFGPGLHRVFNG